MKTMAVLFISFLALVTAHFAGIFSFKGIVPPELDKFISPALPEYKAQSPIVDFTGQVELLGNPFADVYTAGNSVYARNIWDMVYFDGEIFLGAGNSSNLGPAPNAGPVRIRAYDIQDGYFVDEGIVDEEQIDILRILGGRLYIPGHDPTESWDLGNFYTRGEKGSWKKHRNIPGALHTYDMALSGEILYAALGIKGGSAVMMSDRDSYEWKVSYRGKSRMYSFLEVDGILYGTGTFLSGKTGSAGKAKSGFVEIPGNGQSFRRRDIGIDELFPDTTFTANRTVKLVRTMNVGKQGVYVGAETHNDHQFMPFGLYVASSLARNKIRVQRIPLPEHSLPWDVTADDRYLYVLAEGKGNTRERLIRILRAPLDDMTSLTELFRFHYETFARSFEVVDGDFYFGMGSEVNNPRAYRAEEISPATGRILRVRRQVPAQ